MIHEHALRKLELHLHQCCLDQDVAPIVENILLAANRGYSLGEYLVKGHFVVAPFERPEQQTDSGATEVPLPFNSESQSRRFLVLLRDYFAVRGTRCDIYGIEGVAGHYR